MGLLKVSLYAVMCPWVAVMFFRPIFWPTLVSAPIFVLLLIFGNWQVNRLQWKNNLVAQIEERTISSPQSLDDILRREQDPDRINYWRVTASGVFDHARELYYFTTDKNGGPVYHVITPLLRDGQPAIFVNRGQVSMERQSPQTRQEGQTTGRKTLVGIVRTPPGQGTFVPDNQPADNLWFFLDMDAMASAVGVSDYLPVIVEADDAPNPGGWPKGGQTVIVLPNNHLGYAITWYGLAVALLGVYLAFHISQGRLGRAGSE